MSTYMRFLYDFMEQFFSGVINIFMGIVRGFGKMFNFKAYLSILKEYSSEFSVGQWILVGFAVLLVFAFLAGILKVQQNLQVSIDQPKILKNILLILKDML